MPQHSTLRAIELARISLDRSPSWPGYLRASGEVRVDSTWHGGPRSEQYWYDFPERFGESVAASANVWLACLLPSAARLGEPLVLRAPVDPVLLENSHDRLAIWHAWNPSYTVVPIEADLAPSPSARSSEPRTACFFSGGVDSFFTALRPRPTPVRDLLLIMGTPDLPLGRDAAFARVRESLAPAAAALGKQLVPLATNVFSTGTRIAAKPHLSYGSELASVALVLEAEIGRLLVPASVDLGWLDAWSTHPLVDALLSTSSTAVVADGVAFTRVEKTEMVARSPIALRSLRVCTNLQDSTNCGACEKCLRTMMALAVCDAIEHAPTFDAHGLDLERCARLPLWNAADRYFIRELEAFARKKEKPEIANAALRACRRSERLERMRAVYHRVRDRPLIGPIARRLAAALPRRD